MSFEECYNSGLRFRQPIESKISDGYWWVDGLYWQNLFDGRINISCNNKLINTISKDLILHRHTSVYTVNDWYLHPEDEIKYRFNKKIEELIT